MQRTPTDSDNRSLSADALLIGAALPGLPEGEAPSLRDLLGTPKPPQAPLLLNPEEMQGSAQPLKEIRKEMKDLLGIPSLGISPATPQASQAAKLLPGFISLKRKVIQDLETHVSRLMTLNPSRREAVAAYLDRLAGHLPGPSSVSGGLDAAGGLRRWIEGPRSPAQTAALQAYFEEVALITLGQILLFKVWSDRGTRAFLPSDLKDPHYAINSELKKHLPHDRENWHVARQNIYSWYKPATLVQEEIRTEMAGWRLQSENPILLVSLLMKSRQARPEWSEPQGYDFRFYQALWQKMPSFGFAPEVQTGPIQRKRTLFSPTLRDGAMVRATSPSVQWIGLESSAYQLMMAELLQLWWNPAPPPLWAVGSGLEVHSPDQLSLSSGSANPKPSLFARISEMEACDAAFVLEERPVRPQGRSPESTRLREQLECLPYFKKIRASGTSLGALQACVALSKLRPGGLLWWAREEPLTENDGKEMLGFLLERAKLVCEWDFSELDHSLPGRFPLFPKHLYLLLREARVEERLTHRPMRISLQGQIRSHVEVAGVLEDALSSLQQRPDPKGSWKVISQTSPTTQREWAERWPDPACQVTLKNLEKLKENSLPLAHATTIRPTPPPDPSGTWSVTSSLKGFWIQGEIQDGRRSLLVHPLPIDKPVTGSGLMVLLTEESWVAPLSSYLASEPVRAWLDHHAERKGERWSLNEQVLRCIPVPRLFLDVLRLRPDERQAGAVADLLSRPDPARVAKLDAQTQLCLYIECASELARLTRGKDSLLSLVTHEGRIRWGALIKMLPPSECVTPTLHSKIKVTGNLPLHLAIGRIDRVKAPAPGVLFATEAGFSLCLSSDSGDSGLIQEMIWDQVEDLKNPTWHEIVETVRLPRRIELAQSTAREILKMHGEQSGRAQALHALLNSCSLL